MSSAELSCTAGMKHEQCCDSQRSVHGERRRPMVAEVLGGPSCAVHGVLAAILAQLHVRTGHVHPSASQGFRHRVGPWQSFPDLFRLELPGPMASKRGSQCWMVPIARSMMRLRRSSLSCKPALNHERCCAGQGLVHGERSRPKVDQVLDGPNCAVHDVLLAQLDSGSKHMQLVSLLGNEARTCLLRQHQNTWPPGTIASDQ